MLKAEGCALFVDASTHCAEQGCSVTKSNGSTTQFASKVMTSGPCEILQAIACQQTFDRNLKTCKHASLIHIKKHTIPTMTGDNEVKQEISEAVKAPDNQPDSILATVATDKPPSFEDVYQAIMLQKVSLVFQL